MMVKATRTQTVSCSATGLAIVALCCAKIGLASGYSAMPEVREVFTSHRACVVRLHESASEHRAQVKPRTLNADGGFQEIVLENISEGIKIVSRRLAKYEARIWYHNGRRSEDGNQYEISHSWDQSSYECRGKTMTVNIARGYTLSTFEPVKPSPP
jgi:hypothetical protein